jgi:hypothetical protein
MEARFTRTEPSDDSVSRHSRPGAKARAQDPGFSLGALLYLTPFHCSHRMGTKPILDIGAHLLQAWSTRGAVAPPYTPYIPFFSQPRTTMIIILAILAATRASPLGLPSPPILSLDQLQARGPSCNDPNGCRSLGDIIRSCILTILLCTWVSMHPNIPSPDEKWPKVALRRAGLMLLALFFPEAVVAWALRQRQVAAELAKEHKSES